MAKIKVRVDTLDAVEEAFRPLYKQVEGGTGFVLDADPVGGWSVEDVGALKRSLENEKERRRIDSAEHEPFKKLGMTAEQVQQSMVQLGELLKIDPEKKADALAEQKAEARVREVMTQAGQQLEKKEKLLKAIMGYTEKRLVSDVAEREITSLKGSKELLMPVIERHTRVVWSDDGVPRVEVLNEERAPRIKDAATGALMGIADLVSELRKNASYAGAFQGSGAEGGGASGGTSGGVGGGAGGGRSPMTGQPSHRGDFSDGRTKALWIREHGQDAFLKLPPMPKAS